MASVAIVVAGGAADVDNLTSYSKPNVFIIFNEHVLNMVFGVWQPVAYGTLLRS